METNKEHWDRIGKGYSNNWSNFAKSKLSQKETDFILKHFLAKKRGNVLDIGPGNGRIVQSYLNTNKNIKVLGLDISDSMVKFCQEKFRKYPNVKIVKCDTSKENIPTDNNFDFISAIRILKYNKNWRDIVTKLAGKLTKDGVMVFTMLNNNSMDRFSQYRIKTYKTEYKKIKEILAKNKLEIIEITTFSKIMDFFYNAFGKNKIMSQIILLKENILEKIFGKILFGRSFFIAVKKK